VNRRNPSLDSRITILDSRSASHRSTAKTRAPKAFGVRGYAVKTLGSKETRASKEIRVTHNSVFAAHRLQCRMTNRKNRHPAFCFCRKINKESRNSGKQRSGSDSGLGVRLTRYFSIRETCPAASCQRPSRLISVSVNCTTRSNGLSSAVPFTRVFPRTTAVSLP
jgi:hypothetical protein